MSVLMSAAVNALMSPVVATSSNQRVGSELRSRRIHIGLGANLGEAEASIREALVVLEDWAYEHDAKADFKHSRLYRSSAIGGPGPDYINAVAQCYCALGGNDILSSLQAIENRFGRTRSYPNAPRTLDLDLLLINGEHLLQPHLIVPHPRLTERAFVLKPLAELQPLITLSGKPIREWILLRADQYCEPIGE
jgi:2-amino-4-hydroxy-6-hydroxymethyldihydropteridine diphosphokinase